MSLTTEQLLAIRRALTAKVELAGLRCFPTAIEFKSASDFWTQVDPAKNTQKAIETPQIAAVWIRFLRFEDVAETENADAAEADSPMMIRYYELTVFRQKSYERLDEDRLPDDFLQRLLKTEIEIEADISALVAEFRGIQTLTDLLDDEFSVRETNSLSQDEFIENEVECEFVKGAAGSQARLICPVKIQLKEC